MSRTAGSGYVHELIVKSILGGARTNQQISMQLKAYIAGEALIRVLKRMEKIRWLGRNQRGYFVTDVGRRCLPGYVLAPQPWQMTTYRPPTPPPRRDGSDWSHVPSIVAANTLQEYRRHV